MSKIGNRILSQKPRYELFLKTPYMTVCWPLARFAGMVGVISCSRQTDALQGLYARLWQTPRPWKGKIGCPIVRKISMRREVSHAGSYNSRTIFTSTLRKWPCNQNPSFPKVSMWLMPGWLHGYTGIPPTGGDSCRDPNVPPLPQLLSWLHIFVYLPCIHV